jgi:hypothetical protein
MMICVFCNGEKIWSADPRRVTRGVTGSITVHTKKGDVIIGPATAREIVRVLQGGVPDDLDAPDPEWDEEQEKLKTFLRAHGMTESKPSGASK